MRLVNEYGPTETVVGCVAQDVSGPYRLDAVQPGSRSVARLELRIYILDVHGEPVPVGVVGQLHIAGVQMARGYRDRPCAHRRALYPPTRSLARPVHGCTAAAIVGAGVPTA
ncbi:hypothetical protein EBA03_10915 [Xanthomonas oryzae pv. oryzae]|uniref:AMP-binding protein n=1 Tax=Xanthomonas oryzae TaxID=347 RepID=UPI001058E094|nr:hypothetical protein EBA03_10915 [Xanthomonas oryzae pv. oryzae]